MHPRSRAIFIAAAGAIAAAACSPDVTDIHAETTGPSGTGGHRTQGAGGASSASSGSGAGGNGVGAGRVITADTDSERLVTGTFKASSKVLDGPFVLTDTFGGTMTVVFGASCGAGQHQATSGEQHGMRLYVPAGASLCNDYGGDGVYSGFKPY